MYGVVVPAELRFASGGAAEHGSAFNGPRHPAQDELQVLKPSEKKRKRASYFKNTRERALDYKKYERTSFRL